MPRDYAKKSTTKRKPSRKKNQSSFPLIRILLTAMLVAGFAGGLYYLKQSPAIAPVQTQVKVAKIKIHNVKPRFTFYDLLANQPTTSEQSAESAPSQVYLLQVASYTNYAQADRLKAKLLLDGYAAEISSHRQGSKTINRVEVGPFSDLNAARHVQRALHKQHLQTWMRVRG